MIKKFKTLALVENLDRIIDFLEQCLKEASIDMKKKSLLYVACEEIFVNISKYAYQGIGDVEIIFEYNGKEIMVTFVDSGVKFNPVDTPNPDVGLPADKRKIGGLGIYVVKNTMDDLIYSYYNNQNHLTLVKGIS